MSSSSSSSSKHPPPTTPGGEGTASWKTSGSRIGRSSSRRSQMTTQGRRRQQNVLQKWIQRSIGLSQSQTNNNKTTEAENDTTTTSTLVRLEQTATTNEQKANTATVNNNENENGTQTQESELFTVRNIDHAMNSLYSTSTIGSNGGYGCGSHGVADVAVEDVCDDNDDDDENENVLFDWILDGHVSFPAEQERSKQLLHALRGRSNSTLDDFEVVQEAATIAIFDDNNDDKMERHAEHDNNDNDDNDADDDDEFGDFQMAPTQTDNLPLSSSSSSSSQQQDKALISNVDNDGDNCRNAAVRSESSSGNDDDEQPAHDTSFDQVVAEMSKDLSCKIHNETDGNQVVPDVAVAHASSSPNDVQQTCPSSVPREIYSTSNTSGRMMDDATDIVSLLDVEDDNDDNRERRRYELYSSLSQMYNVSSPEGRFTRRRIQQQQSNLYTDRKRNSSSSTSTSTCCRSMVDGDNDKAHSHHDNIDEKGGEKLELPECYFSNPDWDVTLDVLRSMPWQHVVLLSNNDNMNDDDDDEENDNRDNRSDSNATPTDPTSLVQDFIAQRLSQLDASHVMVHSKLMKRAVLQEHALSRGNAMVHEMHHNVCMAAMYVERSKESMVHARGCEDDCTGVLGATVLLRKFHQRDDYSHLERQLAKVDGILEMERELNGCIQAFGKDRSIGHDVVLERVRQLYQTANDDDDLSRLHCLNDLRQRTSRVLGTFRSEIEECLCAYIDNICHNWSMCSDKEYERLFRALMAVEEARLHSSSETTCNDDDIVEIWSKCISKTLCFQIDKCFARALLDPTDSRDSEYDKELIHLGFELSQDSRDVVKLISLTHNLVTIRFDFEVSCNYLPMVYHQLCTMLTEVLHAHHLLSQHHEALLKGRDVGEKSIDHGKLEQIDTAIRYTKVDIWRGCEQILIKCLEQYHHFAAKKVLFPKDKIDDGSVWLEDLHGLHDVLRLTKQFLSLGCEFLDSDQMEVVQVSSLMDHKCHGELREKLCDVFRKHLRAVHVEAMTSLGASLFHESWQLAPLSVGGTVSVSPSRDKDRVQLVQEHLMGIIDERCSSGAPTKVHYSDNEMSRRTNGDRSVLSTMKSEGNPFLRLSKRPRSESHVSFHPVQSRNGPQLETNKKADATSRADEISIFSTICKLCEDEQLVLPAIATESVNKLILKWFSRLLSVMLQLPLVVDDITKIFRDLCDLYYITAFRLCAGNAQNERIILGIDQPTPIVAQDSLEQVLRSPRSTSKKQSPGFMGFARRPSGSSLGHQRRGSGRVSGSTVVVSGSVEAELFAPLPSNSQDISRLRDFITAGQDNLESVVKLGKLEQRLRDPIPQSDTDEDYVVELVNVLKKRQATAWSCLVVAALLNITCQRAERVLTRSFLDEMIGVNGSQATSEAEESVPILGSLASYSTTASHVAPHMVELCSQIACAHAMMGKRMVKEVVSVDGGWEQSRLNEHSNHYVDTTCQRYALMWRSLSSPPSALPRGILKVAWEHICEAGFLALLDGFSRVPYCSTEGRSLMSMDLASFASGIDVCSILERLGADESISVPPRVSPNRGMSYVDMYVKVFYYPEEDVMRWIVSNFVDYQLNHMLALLTCRANDQEDDKKDIKKLVESVQALYSVSPSSGQGSGQRQE